VRVADQWSDSLDAPLAIIHKRRDPNVANQVTVNEIVGHVEGRVCLLVDDMIDTGGTIVKAAQALKANGAERVIVAATHAVFSAPATERLQDTAIDEVVVTDTIPCGREALPGADDSADRAAARARSRSLRGRLGHEHVRRRRLSPPPPVAAA
jgi:ribose-phosphate pyrophosphokinase